MDLAVELSPEEFSEVPYDFGKKFFPRKVNGKINTLEFLEASRGIVKLIDKLGKAFTPLSNDISGNIEKIRKCYEKNPAQYGFIEDMILSEKLENNEFSIDALLWLRRALHFILIFFQNIINDAMRNECLQEHMSSAYSQTLEPYHGWITRNLFKVTCKTESFMAQELNYFSFINSFNAHNENLNWSVFHSGINIDNFILQCFKTLVPKRSALLSTLTSDGKENEKENLIKFLKPYIQSLAENVQHITSFYKEHNLDSTAKV